MNRSEPWPQLSPPNLGRIPILLLTLGPPGRVTQILNLRLPRCEQMTTRGCSFKVPPTVRVVGMSWCLPSRYGVGGHTRAQAASWEHQAEQRNWKGEAEGGLQEPARGEVREGLLEEEAPMTVRTCVCVCVCVCVCFSPSCSPSLQAPAFLISSPLSLSALTGGLRDTTLRNAALLPQSRSIDDTPAPRLNAPRLAPQNCFPPVWKLSGLDACHCTSLDTHTHTHTHTHTRTCTHKAQGSVGSEGENPGAED